YSVVRHDVFSQGLRQYPRPSLWNRPARADRGIGAATGHWILRRRHARWGAHHERTAVVVLKIIAKNLPLRHGQSSLPYFALGMFGQALGHRLAAKSGRRQAIAIKH